MADPNFPELNIVLPRQGDFVKEYQFTDTAGVPVDITGHTLTWQARKTAGTGAVLASATITILEASSGRFKAKWHGPDFDEVEGPTEIVRVAHDLKDIYPNGVIDVPVRGQIILLPEVTA
ncbi:hypothetical protein [Sphingomonas soli]|uniref:hypothetical protein n=1 Tax=Sphingomonas soli TaxID=266127 RepID=UPI00082C4E56|nr:hypothetical protein [Sphingomonas soli]